MHALHQSVDDDLIASRIARDLQPFVAFDARQRDSLARRNRARDRERLVKRPRAGAAFRHAQLDQRGELARHRLGACE